MLEVKDGNNLEELVRAIQEAQKDESRPSLIMVSTHIGYGSPKQDSFEVHGSPLKPEEVVETRKFFGWPLDQDFYVPEEALNHMREIIREGEEKEKEWNNLFSSYAREFPELAQELTMLIKGELPPRWDEGLPVFDPASGDIATRSAGGKVLNALADKIPSLIGGSADLDPSTNTVLKGKGLSGARFVPHGTSRSCGRTSGVMRKKYCFWRASTPWGSPIFKWYCHSWGLIPFGATFFVFSDYMRPATRVAALPL